MSKASTKSKLSPAEYTKLTAVLQTRFEKNMQRHKGTAWADVKSKLDANPAKAWSLAEMERTGGEPDVVAYNKKTNEYTFCDCSAESPKDRRSLCYDRQALNARKENKPKDTVVDMAEALGVDLLTEEQYRQLQTLGEFDAKTSSWIKTPDDIRKLGGAVYCDYRYGHVFLGHNGADSYYAARGFRGSLKV